MSAHHHLSAQEALSLIASDKLTVTEYAQSLLARIEDRQPTVRAWAFFDPKQILKQAAVLDALPAEHRGVLHGIPIVKDVILTKDQPTRYHSPIYASAGHSNIDAACVKILRAAGALILGKTETTEFAATPQGGPCTNPHDPTRTPGGSSSGSAAAVADFQIPLAVGTQTGGSTMIPAAYNGIFGFKPTWNAISVEGAKTASISCDTIGLFSRSIGDLTMLSKVFRLEDDQPVPSEAFQLQGATIGFCKGPNWSAAGEGTRGAMSLARRMLEEAGAVVEDVDLPSGFGKICDWYPKTFKGEGRSSFLSEYCLDKTRLAPNLREHIERPLSEVSRKDQLEAFDGIAKLRPRFDEIASSYAAILTPSAIDEAGVGLDYPGNSVFNYMWSILHTPVVNIPGFKGAADMPIGLSLVGARFRDQHLLHVAGAVAKVFTAGEGNGSAP